MHLVIALTQWVFRHLLSFIVIVLILVAGKYLYAEFTRFASEATQIRQLSQAQQRLQAFSAKSQADTVARVATLRDAPSAALRARIAAIDDEVTQLQATQKSTAEHTVALVNGDFTDTAIDIVEKDITLVLLRQERAHLAYLDSIASNRHNLQAAQRELARLHQVHVAAWAQLKDNAQRQEALRQQNPVAFWFLGTRAFEERRQLMIEHASLLAANRHAHQQYQRQKKQVDLMRMPGALREFTPSRAELDRVLDPVSARITALEQRHRENWVHVLTQPVFAVLPTALLILLGMVLAPVLVKAFFYYIVAPAAARRAPVCLLPDVDGTVTSGAHHAHGQAGRRSTSAVSQVLQLDAGEELLVHPEYLQSSSDAGIKDTKWLLNHRFPITSIAAGLFALTRIRATAPQSYVISATKEPLSEVGIIALPRGAAVVLQPHNLVGVVQPQDRPVRITQHWRLASLKAWLTLQLRFMVFHGPATLIVKGCRGVRLEPAASGRSINQAATIGFSANLVYSTTRCETFVSYLRGKQELFNDNFSGGPGVAIYEEMPHYGKKGGITGRGLQGIADSLFKIVGI